MKKEVIKFYNYEPFKDWDTHYYKSKGVFKNYPTPNDQKTEYQKDLYKQSIGLIFNEDYNKLTYYNTYFYGCPIDIYKHTYKDRLNNFLEVFNEAKEIDFIKFELSKGISKIDYIILPETRLRIEISLNKRFEYLKNRALELSYIITRDKEDYTMQPTATPQQIVQTTNERKITLNITQTELIELVKALVENGNIKGTQKDAIQDFSNYFNIKVNNPNKLIQDIKGRYTDRETIFLDKLKNSLLDYLSK